MTTDELEEMYNVFNQKIIKDERYFIRRRREYLLNLNGDRPYENWTEDDMRHFAMFANIYQHHCFLSNMTLEYGYDYLPEGVKEYFKEVWEIDNITKAPRICKDHCGEPWKDSDVRKALGPLEERSNI